MVDAGTVAVDCGWMNRAPLQLLAAVDKLHGLLDTMHTCTVSGGAKGIPNEPFKQLVNSALDDVCELREFDASGNVEAATLCEEMEKWRELFLVKKTSLSPDSVGECVRCLSLLNGILWNRVCDRKIEPLIKPMNPMSPLKGIFHAFGNESMSEWDLTAVIEYLSRSRVALAREWSETFAKHPGLEAGLRI